MNFWCVFFPKFLFVRKNQSTKVLKSNQHKFRNHDYSILKLKLHLL